MSLLLQALVAPQPPNLASFPLHHSVKFPSKLCAFPPHQNDTVLFPEEEDPVIGDCLVFDESAFEHPFKPPKNDVVTHPPPKTLKTKIKTPEIETDNLVPEKWREIQAEINITKKDRRKIAQELQFNSRVERKRRGLKPIRSVDLDEYAAFKEAKLKQLKPVLLDNPVNLSRVEEEEEEERREIERVKGKNPRWAVYGRGFDDVNEFFNSSNYQPSQNNAEGSRKLFTKEEKVLLNKRIPDLAAATSRKWLPLHTLAASGEFYLLDALLKHNVDINGVDEGSLTALHKAIIGKKQAITSYLLRESANPFVRDDDGATLIHYAVQTASIPAIKLLLLYDVDINLPDNDGWTPLHLAVQTRRTDVVKLLLIKGADKTLRNKDGLTPLDLCLYSGQDTRTYELIKLLKQLPRKSAALAKVRSANISAT